MAHNDPTVSSSLTVTPASVIALGVMMPVISVTVVGLRFYFRISRKIGVGADDYLILFAMICCSALGIMMIAGSAEHALAVPTPPGVGKMGFLHVIYWATTIAQKMKFVTNIVQPWAFGAVKISVLAFYRRIFRGQVFSILNWILIGLVAIWSIAFSFAAVFNCGTDWEANWTDLFHLLHYCFSQNVYKSWLSISDVIMDGAIMILPIPLVCRLQLSRGRKLAVVTIFILGAGAIAASITRLVVFESQLTDSSDSTQGIMFITTWIYYTELELGISILAACSPTFKPLFGSLSPETLSKFRSIFSLRSRSSSRRSPAAGSATKKPSQESISSGPSSHRREDRESAGAYALQDLPSPVPAPSNARILVESSFHTTSTSLEPHAA